MTWQRYNKNLRKSALLAEYFSFWTDLGTSAKDVHEPEHSIPAPNRHGSKFLPIHRGFALMAVLFGIKATDRVKSFLFRFIDVPAKWIKTARQYKLNIYSEKPYDLIWEHG